MPLIEMVVTGLVLVAVFLACFAALAWYRRKVMARSPRTTTGGIEELERLHRQGLLTDEEFKKGRRAALGLDPEAGGAEEDDESREPLEQSSPEG